MPIWRPWLQPSSRPLRARSLIPGPVLSSPRYAASRLVLGNHGRQRLPFATARGGSDGRASAFPRGRRAAAPTEPPRKKIPTFYDRMQQRPIRPHPRDTPVLVELFTPPAIKSEAYLSRHQHLISVCTQLYHDHMRDQRQWPDPDWRTVVQLLADHTVPRSQWEAVILRVPNSNPGLEELQRNQETGIQEIMDRTGCALQIKGKSGGENKDITSIVVYGPPQRKQSAVNMILAKVGTASIRPVSSSVGLETEYDNAGEPEASDEAKAIVDVEAVAETYRPSRSRFPPPSQDTYMVEDIPQPEAWSKENLDEYFARITNSRLANNAWRYRGRRTKVPHLDAVCTILERIFSDPKAASALSVPAFRRALRFMSHYAPYLQRQQLGFLLYLSQRLDLPVGTESYNILLAGFCRLKDLRSYEWALRIMLEQGCVPNFGTWLTMMRIFESNEVRRFVLHIMEQKGMLSSPLGIRKIAPVWVKHDMHLAIDKGESLDSFLADQDTLYGDRENWLTRLAGYRIVSALCSHGRFCDAFTLLELMYTPGLPHGALADAQCFNTILFHATRQRRRTVALETLQLQAQLTKVRPDDEALTRLFELFWRTRMPLAASVIWHYAVLHRGRNSNETRRRILRARARKALAGQEVAGKQSYLASLLSALPQPTPKVLHNVEGQPRPGTEEAVASIFADYVPVAQLDELLKDAMELDAEAHREIAAAVKDGSLAGTAEEDGSRWRKRLTLNLRPRLKSDPEQGTLTRPLVLEADYRPLYEWRASSSEEQGEQEVEEGNETGAGEQAERDADGRNRQP